MSATTDVGASTPPRLGAVVLAGGTGRRLGGVNKADVELAGRRLLDRVLDALAGIPTVVVGDVDADRPGVRVVVEDPPRSGPAAGIVAGLAALSSPPPLPNPRPDDAVLVLACDLADPLPGVRALLDALPLADGVDGYCLGDADGRAQWLFGLYRATALHGAIADAGSATHGSVRALLASLTLATISAPGVSSDDIDTWDAHARWSARLSASG